VNAKIRQDFALEENRSVPIAQAKELGAMALFGEKYGDEVRTIKFGSSIELCGGTHISSTGRIGAFRIVSESAIAAGVRRIEAVTAKGCEDYLYAQEDMIHSLKTLFNNAPDLVSTIAKFIEENHELKKQVENFMKDAAEKLKEKVLQQPERINGITLYRLTGEVPASMVKDIAFGIKAQSLENTAFVAATSENGKPQLLVMLTDDVVAQGLDAGKMVREAAQNIQGGGGGQKHFATAGGKQVDGLTKALEALITNF
jgi:alanyl-tRNA synthetase